MTLLKPMPDTFTAAAMGDTAAQEEMCSTTLAGQTLDMLSDATIVLAYTYASQAYATGSRSIRPKRVCLLVAMAWRSLAAGEPTEAARTFLADALGHLYELDHDGDTDAMPFADKLIASIIAAPALGDPAALVERGKEVAARRIATTAALTTVEVQLTKGVAATLH